MKKILLSLVVVMATFSISWGQFSFDPQVNFETVEVPNWLPTTVLAPSPLKFQVIFVGSNDMVQTTETYGNAAGETVAKEWHDFIGFTADTVADSEDLGWLSVNHEMIQSNDMIGDGGGMTVFKIARDADTDTIMVVEQTLADGRTGKFFNVDFANTVGETGMNCGGISAPDGRIWTAEEWFRDETSDIWSATDGQFGTMGVRDTMDWTISTDLPGDMDGAAVRKFENFNYMVEIDPREAKAIRKQYNWGRMPYEGGVVLPDNQTVYLGADAIPGWYIKFVADTPGDFTTGSTFVYKHDAAEKWIEIDNTSLDSMLLMNTIAGRLGGTMYNRLEWGAYHDGKVYWTETGNGSPGRGFRAGEELGGVYAPYHVDRAAAQAEYLLAEGDIDSATAANFGPGNDEYYDYFGRVWVHDLATDEITSYIEGGWGDEDLTLQLANFNVYDYTSNHLSNPDGLNFMTVNPGTEEEKTFMIICEDMNSDARNVGAMPRGITDNRTCEMWMLDMEIENPTADDLIRIGAVPLGAEVTGAIATPDGKTLFVNSQHPSSSNPFPYGHSLTYAITGWTEFATAVSNRAKIEENVANFTVYPNPVARTINFDEVMDVAIYSLEGKRLKVVRQTKSVDVSDLPSATYVIMNDKGFARKIVVNN